MRKIFMISMVFVLVFYLFPLGAIAETINEQQIEMCPGCVECMDTNDLWELPQNITMPFSSTNPKMNPLDPRS